MEGPGFLHASPEPGSDDEVPQDPRPQARIGGKGLKRPYQPRDPSPDMDEQPDLSDYFSRWDIPPKDQILMCRSYASYLAVQSKPRQAK